jgi:hypothetical protein
MIGALLCLWETPRSKGVVGGYHIVLLTVWAGGLVVDFPHFYLVIKGHGFAESSWGGVEILSSPLEFHLRDNVRVVMMTLTWACRLSKTILESLRSL